VGYYGSRTLQETCQTTKKEKIKEKRLEFSYERPAKTVPLSYS